LAQYPHVPGYSSVARVVRVGTNVNEDWIGRIVACRAGHCGFALQPLDSIHEVPTIVPPEEASFHTLVQIALNGIRRSGLRLGETVVIFGMGIVGHLAALFCRLGGACPVIAVDSSAYRLGLLPDDDLLVTINSSRDDLLAAVREHARGRADVGCKVPTNGGMIGKTGRGPNCFGWSRFIDLREQPVGGKHTKGEKKRPLGSRAEITSCLTGVGQISLGKAASPRFHTCPRITQYGLITDSLFLRRFVLDPAENRPVAAPVQMLHKMLPVLRKRETQVGQAQHATGVRNLSRQQGGAAGGTGRGTGESLSKHSAPSGKTLQIRCRYCVSVGLNVSTRIVGVDVEDVQISYHHFHPIMICLTSSRDICFLKKYLLCLVPCIIL
jgi:hypothetical protein